MVYWLGGEWGVFQTSYKVVNPSLSLDERSRHMETAFRIDILARTGIISLLPLGLHMGHLWGVQPFGGMWLTLLWLIWAAWLAVTWGAFAQRGTRLGNTLSRIEDWTRYLLIPVLITAAVSSLSGNGPFAGDPGQKWYAAKILTYGLMLGIGVILRLIMHEWRALFPILAGGPDPSAEAKLLRSIRLGRSVAYVYWGGILFTAFLGATKPF